MSMNSTKYSTDDESSVPMYFESDLIMPRDTTIWRKSFEWWWIRKSLHEKFGACCMNCKMEKKEGITLEITQVIPKKETYNDLVNLKNYQILCRRCNDNKDKYTSNDFRPENWNAIVSAIPDVLTFPNNNASFKLKDLHKLRHELSKNKIIADDSNLSREVKLSKLISTCHHGFINKAARNKDFIERDNKYIIYLKMLLMRFENLKKKESYSNNTFSDAYQLKENSIRKYIIDHYGGISKTSIVYAIAKEEHRRSRFLKSW